MKSTRIGFVLLIPLLLVTGCIVGDQLTTITIHPDGSADLVIFGSNLHSTQTGAQAARELAEYKAKFDSQSQEEMARIRDAGGKILKASWIRQQTPFSNVVYAELPDASALEKFGTHKNSDGSLQMAMQCQNDGSHRRLDLHITTQPGTFESSRLMSEDVGQLRQMLANGISETRIAVTGGTITGARGFTVAEDMQSALFDVNEISKLLQTSGGKAELHLEWEVTR